MMINYKKIIFVLIVVLIIVCVGCGNLESVLYDYKGSINKEEGKKTYDNKKTSANEEQKESQEHTELYNNYLIVYGYKIKLTDDISKDLENLPGYYSVGIRVDSNDKINYFYHDKDGNELEDEESANVIFDMGRSYKICTDNYEINNITSQSSERDLIDNGFVWVPAKQYYIIYYMNGEFVSLNDFSESLNRFLANDTDYQEYEYFTDFEKEQINKADNFSDKLWSFASANISNQLETGKVSSVLCIIFRIENQYVENFSMTYFPVSVTY